MGPVPGDSGGANSLLYALVAGSDGDSFVVVGLSGQTFRRAHIKEGAKNQICRDADGKLISSFHRRESTWPLSRFAG